MHPQTRHYTRLSVPHYYSAIDYFFVFSLDRLRIKDSQIATTDISDHSPIALIVDLKGDIKYWQTYRKS